MTRLSLCQDMNTLYVQIENFIFLDILMVFDYLDHI